MVRLALDASLVECLRSACPAGPGRCGVFRLNRDRFCVNPMADDLNILLPFNEYQSRA